jgi:hypothetical protein
MRAIGVAGRSGNVIRLEPKRQQALFSCRDLMDLSEWDGAGRRVDVDRREDLDGLGQFAMVFEGEQPWASWAIGREGGRILLWDCVTLADVGRFDTMRDTLAAIPGPGARRAAPSAGADVIPFAALQARRSAA